MDEIGIEIERQYQGEEHDFHFLSANNGIFQGTVEIYCDKGHLKKIGKGLIHWVDEIFSKNPNELSYSIGSNRPEDKSDYVMLRVNKGVLHVSMIAETGGCLFTIGTEPWGIHRLGELIMKFSEEKYRLLKWSPNADKDMLAEWESSKQIGPKQGRIKLPQSKDWKSGLKDFIASIESTDFMDYR